MAYWADLSYYKDTFKGVDTGEDFAVLLDRAQDVLNILTLYRYDSMTDPPVALRKALCYEIEHLHLLGGNEAVHGITGADEASESLGSYSVTYNRQTQVFIHGIPVSAMAYDILQAGGYLYCGMGVRQP